MTLLCVPIFLADEAQARRDMALAAEAGADLIELRLDECTDVSQFAELIRNAPCPVISTLRPEWEGGQSMLADVERADLLRAAGESGAAYVDLELRAVAETSSVRPQKPADSPRLIISHHDFQGRPDRLYNVISELNASPSDVNKIVWTARTIRDNLEAFEILQHRQKPTIALCIGEAGLVSRVLAKKFGAFLTFASLKAGAGTAAGQVPIDDMKRLYRWDSIGPKTKVYGVVGSPVAHSMSPAIHNASFEQVGFDGVYVPLLVNEGYESFKAFMESFVTFPGLEMSGLSVTIPHKENALRYLTVRGVEIDPLAKQIGAVNTIIVDRDGPQPKLRGMNTDYAAILDSITATLGINRQQLKGVRVAVIGAGGTGRTATAALAHYGATVVVYNRTREKADQLAMEFNGKSGKVVAAPMEKLCDSCCQIYINTTSVGMHPKVNASPFDDKGPKLSSDTVVFDTVYNPIQTKLLRHAKEAGAKTIGGVEMFVRQAAAQFEAWTRTPAPVDVMRKVVESRLSP